MLVAPELVNRAEIQLKNKPQNFGQFPLLEGESVPSPTAKCGTVEGRIVVTTGIEPSSNIGNALVSAMYGRSSELIRLIL